MASHLELMIRQLRSNLQEEIKFRYAKVSTTSDGASDGSTLVSTTLTEGDNIWNGCEALILAGAYEGQFRKIEDFTASSDTLSFTNDPWPAMIVSGTSFEIAEGGVFKHYALKQYLIQAINFMAGILPKTVLRNYVRMASYSSTLGVASITGNFIDVHFITIDNKPAIQIPPERSYRMLSGKDAFLPPTTTSRYLYYFRGTSSTASELIHAPATTMTVRVHGILTMTDFESDGSTYWPRELWDVAIHYATGLALTANEDLNLAQGWFAKAQEFAKSKGAKASFVSRQEKGG